jgi:elongation factor P
MLTFMDMATYEQIEIERDFIGERAQFLTDGMKVLVQSYEGRPIGLQMPQHVTLTVTEADAVMRGGTAAPSYKNAVLENGMKILVPPFVDAGTKVIVSTEDGSYVKRAEA